MKTTGFQKLLKSIDEARAIRAGKHKPSRVITFDPLSLLEANPAAAREYAKLFAELPLPTQLAIMRRRRKLSHC